MADIAEIGFSVDTAPLERGERKLNDLGEAGERAGSRASRGQQQFSRQTRKTNNAISAQERRMQSLNRVMRTAAGVLPAAGTMAQATEPSPATMTTAELLTAREEANAACWDRMRRHLALCEELERRGAVEPSGN